MNLPPELHAVFAADEKRPALIATFPTAIEACNWATMLARDFRRRYLVVRYKPDGSESVIFDPPGPAASVNGQFPPLSGSQHKAKRGTKRYGHTGRGRNWQRDQNALEPRRIE